MTMIRFLDSIWWHICSEFCPPPPFLHPPFVFPAASIDDLYIFIVQRNSKMKANNGYYGIYMFLSEPAMQPFFNSNYYLK